MALIAIDFDLTITAKHTHNILAYTAGSARMTADAQYAVIQDIKPKGQEGQWANIIKDLLAQGHTLAIVSFNDYKIIPQYLKSPLGLSDDLIEQITIESRLPPNSAEQAKGKKVHIENVLNLVNNNGKKFEWKDVILIDDDNKNINQAQASGAKGIYADDEGKFLDTLLQKINTLTQASSTTEDKAENKPEQQAVQLPALQDLPKVISQPGQFENSKSDQNEEYHFGYSELKGHRNFQEDALAWHILDNNVLARLSPEEIGMRLWTTYRQLDKDHEAKGVEGGTTASTTVFDGKGNLITATLADAASFAAIYDSNNKIKKVIRLNSLTHKPEYEVDRIIGAKGYVEKIFYNGFGTIDSIKYDSLTNKPECEFERMIKDGQNDMKYSVIHRLQGDLAVSRAIGDDGYKKFGLISSAKIDITNVTELAKQSGLGGVENIGKIQIITTCDGFTDASGAEQTIDEHQTFLFELLKAIEQEAGSHIPSEKQLAEKLANYATNHGSFDNVSVAVQTIVKPSQQSPAFMMGVYDGHGSNTVAHYVAENIGQVFSDQCKKTASEYEQQDLSVHKHKQIFEDDHKHDDNYAAYNLGLPAEIVKPIVTTEMPIVPDAPEPIKQPQEAPQQSVPPPADTSIATTSTDSIVVKRMVVKTLGGPTDMFFYPGDTILSIKQYMSDKQGIPIDQQSLIINGKRFPNSHILDEKDFMPNDPLTVHLILQLRGDYKPIVHLGHLSYEQLETLDPAVAEALDKYYQKNPSNTEQNIRQYWNDHQRVHQDRTTLLEMAKSEFIDNSYEQKIDSLQKELKRQDKQRHDSMKEYLPKDPTPVKIANKPQLTPAAPPIPPREEKKPQDETIEEPILELTDKDDFDTIYNALLRDRYHFFSIISEEIYNQKFEKKKQLFNILLSKAETADQWYKLSQLQSISYKNTGTHGIYGQYGGELLDKAAEAGHILAMRERASLALACRFYENSMDDQISWGLDCLHYIEQTYIPQMEEGKTLEKNPKLLDELRADIKRMRERITLLPAAIPPAGSAQRLQLIEDLKKEAQKTEFTFQKNSRALPVPKDIKTIAKLHFKGHPEIIKGAFPRSPKTINPLHGKQIQTFSFPTIKKAVSLAVEKYQEWFNSRCTSNKAKQDVTYTNWYKKQHADDKKMTHLNDPQIRKAFTEAHRGAAGTFTRFFHHQGGQDKAEALLNFVNSCSTSKTPIEDVKNVINNHLKNDKTAYRAHSFASFLLDELSNIEGSPWHGIKPGKENRYSQKQVSEYINRDNAPAQSRYPRN